MKFYKCRYCGQEVHLYEDRCPKCGREIFRFGDKISSDSMLKFGEILIMVSVIVFIILLFIYLN